MTPPTILLAEDNQDDVWQIQYSLTTSKIINPLQIVSDGEKAIQYIKGEGPYADRSIHPYPVLLLLDLKMPRKGGFEVLTWVQSQPSHRQLPVVVLSVSGEIQQMNKAYQLGARSFLIKPISFADLTNVFFGLSGIALSLQNGGVCLTRSGAPPELLNHLAEPSTAVAS